MITGSILIGSSDIESDEHFDAVDPAIGEAIAPRFSAADAGHVEQACVLADAAAATFAATQPETRAMFLEEIADAILGIGDALMVRAMAETGLPRARLEGERGRTVGQLRMFAEHVRGGDWLHATIDSALPDRAPSARPDLRRRHVALGPVAVFGASNFPLAFSVAGGDTASALAAGCPVVVKGHPAHPGTGELVARAIRSAVQACGLHEGVFSYLPGPSNALGGALVADPRIKAVGFTGSRAGGLALMQLAAARPEPIPVYAEMSSINPILLFPAALRNRAETIATGFVGSLTMGAGQFCTNPGLLIALAGPDLDRFATAAGAALQATAPGQMLTAAIHGNYEAGVEALLGHNAVQLIARGATGQDGCQARAALFATDADNFVADSALGHEVFGSSSIIVRCRDLTQVAEVVAGLEGQLTATLQIDAEDEPAAAELLPLLERKAGRILANGWPTGVEVCHAMVHGGPYPATSDGRTTSVGTLAIERFLRPVCYQNLPAGLLPAALKPDNPWSLGRFVDGQNGVRSAA
ncbi:aldehyde dehydrogenase family protein [Sphingomonas sp. MAH-20]|uniref:Aldehyde dehydrogenase family protein n=1 Tax=Sphingomonas horti TaxID=2682842 RepID=A0A6I4J3L4_9SPHN|nr:MULTISPECIES: aldehyde dehydrogenase (NADP(+)) [Sphingomonas]MBA2918893.1 aldehyde dehydrogenase (NADP(+)) [Sphingomonas sp. CGMCC 1.13658]MVO78926.1 aldehyde dehydrogenase family protein [Sphingomonas horti]